MTASSQIVWLLATLFSARGYLFSSISPLIRRVPPAPPPLVSERFPIGSIHKSMHHWAKKGVNEWIRVGRKKRRKEEWGSRGGVSNSLLNDPLGGGRGCAGPTREGPSSLPPSLSLTLLLINPFENSFHQVEAYGRGLRVPSTSPLPSLVGWGSHRPHRPPLWILPGFVEVPSRKGPNGR